jgi:formylglycine-generating enzyme required for sulfatase activity
VAWYEENSGNSTHDVKAKQPNELGLYDMSGNVMEWCQDRYGVYQSGSQTNPHGPSMGSIRVIRGGSWDLIAGFCRVAFRSYFSPGSRDTYLGLRLVLQ